MGKKVGIVIPSYNQGKYLEAAIRSVLENKRHADINVVVMDGGSNDESVDIIRKYEQELNAWYSEPDDGQADAINKGIGELPDCDYYMWLNSDDIYESEYSVQMLVDYAYENKLEVCYGLSHFINEHESIIGEYPVEEFEYNKLGERCFLSQPSVMFSRKAYRETGLINKNLNMCLDYEYWMRLAKSYEFGFIKEYIGATRMHENTKTSTMKQQHLKEAISIMQKYYKNVPMRWIAEKILADYPKSILKYIPRRLLILLLLPFRRQIINASMEGNLYD